MRTPLWRRGAILQDVPVGVATGFLDNHQTLSEGAQPFPTRTKLSCGKAEVVRRTGWNDKTEIVKIDRARRPVIIGLRLTMVVDLRGIPGFPGGSPL